MLLNYHSYLWQNQDQNHKIFFDGAYSFTHLPPSWEKSRLYLSLFRRPIINDFPSVQLRNSLVCLSVVGIFNSVSHICKPSLHIDNFPPNQYVPSQSRIQNTQNRRLPCSKVEARDSYRPIRYAKRERAWK